MRKYNLEDEVIFYDWGTQEYLFGLVVEYYDPTPYRPETIYVIRANTFGMKALQHYQKKDIMCRTTKLLNILFYE